MKVPQGDDKGALILAPLLFIGKVHVLYCLCAGLHQTRRYERSAPNNNSKDFYPSRRTWPAENHSAL